MPEDPTKAAGTQDPTEGEPAEPETPTADAEGREKPSGEPDWKSEYLKAKPKIELANRILSDQAARSEADAGTQPAPASADSERRASQRQQRLERIRELQATDPVAAELLEDREDRDQREYDLRRDVADAFVMQGVPEADRPKLAAFYERHRFDPKSGAGHFTSLSAAKEAFEGRTLKSENQKLKERISELEKGKSGGGKEDLERARDDDVRTSSGRDLSRPAHQATRMTREEFRERRDALYAEGRDSEARDLGMKIRRGEIVFRK